MFFNAISASNEGEDVPKEFRREGAEYTFYLTDVGGYHSSSVATYSFEVASSNQSLERGVPEFRTTTRTLRST